ncbi:hypothetical protein GLN3_14610 [Geobacillus lituanicus]|nr:hypothetical protein GLN3_14610 [Geobacillus lituanicus]
MERRNLHEKAYQRAKEIHAEFRGKPYGSPSYFYSLAERFPSLMIDKKEWEKEQKRHTVKRYWQEKNEDGFTFAERIKELFAQGDAKMMFLGRESRQTWTYEELLHRASASFWPFLAHFLKMEEEKKHEQRS